MQFSDYVNVVHQDAYSRQVALELYDAGVLVEAMIKRIIFDNSLDNYPGIAKELGEARRVPASSLDIGGYAEVLEKVFHLSRGKVRFRLFSYEDTCQPFSSFSDPSHRSPDWWDAYNAVKHDFFTNMNRATFKYLISGSAALFLLVALYREDWQNHALRGRIRGGIIQDGEFFDHSVSGGIPDTLSMAFFPHLGVKGGHIQDIVASSTLFNSTLVHMDQSDPNNIVVLP